MKKIILGLSVVGILVSSVFASDTAAELIAKNNCMSCHNVMGMKDAPPFAGIAWRTSRNGDKQTLMQSIKNGSHGKYPMFSNTQMPAFKNLSENDLDTLAIWIMSKSGNMMKCGGKCGGMGRCGNAMSKDTKKSNGSWW
jgi:cytochrome c